MRKLIFIFATATIMFSGCHNQSDMPQFPGLPDVELEADAYEAEIDDEALWEALQAAAMDEKATYILDKDGNWEGVLDRPTSASDLIICIGDESYCYVNLMGEWCPKIGPYAISYDADTNTLHSYHKDDKSKKYSAVVKYFDGENLILDGYFAPVHDRCHCCYGDDSGRHLTCVALDKESREEVIDLL